MADGPVTEVLPHEQVLHIAVRRRSLDATTTETLVDDVETAAAQRPGVPVVLDLTALKFAPSVALGSLVQLSKSFRLDGRRIALIGVGHRIRDPIRVTRLHEVLEIHDTIQQVIDASPK